MSRPNLYDETKGWQKNAGKGCPVPAGALCRAQYGCGHLTPIDKPFLACERRWSLLGEPGDIAAYVVVGMAEI